METSDLLALYLIYIFGGSVHELAHAWSAWRLGDDTAKDQGRLTLNPLAHIDLFGTVLVPGMLLYMGAYPLGWMRPVPVDTTRLGKPRRDHLIVSLMGPAANLFLALLGAVVLVAFALTGTEAPIGP